MAELVDALASGASVLRDVEVQVLLSVPELNKLNALGVLFVAFSKNSMTLLHQNTMLY